MTSFYSREELLELGFKSVGENVMISRKASIYGASNMSIGNNVRIDDFCILSGHITLGNNIHISAYVALYGAMGIEMKDFTGISAHSLVYSAMDDFSGEWLIGPIHDPSLTNVTGGMVTIESFVQIGCHCVIFPGITIGEGVVVGALSLAQRSLDPWYIYIGIPARRLKPRSRRAKDLAY